MGLINEIKAKYYDFLIWVDPREHIIKKQAETFWKLYHSSDTSRVHICGYDLETLSDRHRRALLLLNDGNRFKVGLYIGGKYYSNVWASRSCSWNLANLVGFKEEIDEIDGCDNKYLNYYCAGSCYFDFYNDKENEGLIKELDRLSAIDDKRKL